MNASFAVLGVLAARTEAVCDSAEGVGEIVSGAGEKWVKLPKTA